MLIQMACQHASADLKQAVELAATIFSIIDPHADEADVDHQRSAASLVPDCKDSDVVNQQHLQSAANGTGDRDLHFETALTLTHVLPVREPDQIKQLGIYGWPTAVFRSGRDTPPAVFTDADTGALWSAAW